MHGKVRLWEVCNSLASHGIFDEDRYVSHEWHFLTVLCPAPLDQAITTPFGRLHLLLGR
jgi:hypothetical protein